MVARQNPELLAQRPQDRAAFGKPARPAHKIARRYVDVGLDRRYLLERSEIIVDVGEDLNLHE